MNVAAQCPSDLTFVVESSQRLIEGLHSVLVLTSLHHRVDLVDFIFADQVSNRAVGQDLAIARPVPSARGSTPDTEFLRARGKAGTDLSLLIGRKDVDDTVDRR